MQNIDMVCLQYTMGKTLQRSASVHLLFSFEYVIQSTIIVSTFIKYILSTVDNYMEGRWENKGIYVFYLELVTDLVHLSVYLVFFIIVFTNYGLPLHLVSFSIRSRSLPVAGTPPPPSSLSPFNLSTPSPKIHAHAL